VDNNIGSEYASFTYDRTLRDQPSRSDRLTLEAAPSMPVGAALLVVLLLSLGLWAVIWLAVSSLASAWG
jgi:hypothetical protein